MGSSRRRRALRVDVLRQLLCSLHTIAEIVSHVAWQRSGVLVDRGARGRVWHCLSGHIRVFGGTLWRAKCPEARKDPLLRHDDLGVQYELVP